MFNRCSHKFGEIQEDGYQYCKKCNKAIAVGVLCSHKWEEQKEFTRSIENFMGQIGHCFVLKCKICGELKTFNSRLRD